MSVSRGPGTQKLDLFPRLPCLHGINRTQTFTFINEQQLAPTVLRKLLGWLPWNFSFFMVVLCRALGANRGKDANEESHQSEEGESRVSAHFFCCVHAQRETPDTTPQCIFVVVVVGKERKTASRSRKQTKSRTSRRPGPTLSCGSWGLRTGSRLSRRPARPPSS